VPRIVVIGNDQEYFLRHRRAVVERLVQMGADVTVLTGGDSGHPPLPRGWRYIHLPIDRLSIDPRTDAVLFARCFRHIGELKPDVLHLITLKPAIFGGLAAVARRMAGAGPRRILITIPGLGRLMSPGGRGAGRLSPLLRAVMGRVIRFLSGREGVHFTFETAHDRNYWIAQGFIRADNSTVINGAGVNPAEFYPASPSDDHRKKIRLLFASRLLRSKGLDSYIAAARHFAGNPDIEFVVAGVADSADPDSYTAEELASESSISFLGPVKDMPGLLREVDLVCLPTRYGEGVPRILIEAAASGVACLGSDIDGCREIIKDGVTGVIVPAAGAAATEAMIASAGRYLAQPELLRQQGKAGLARFHERGFSEQAVVARFIELLWPRS